MILLCIDWSYMVRVGSRYVKMYVFKWGCGSLDKVRHVYMLIIQNKIQSTTLPPASDPIRYWVLTPINEVIQIFLSTNGIIFPTLQTLYGGFFQYLLADIQWSIALKFRGPRTAEHLNINTQLDAISVPIVSHQLDRYSSLHKRDASKFEINFLTHGILIKICWRLLWEIDKLNFV